MVLGKACEDALEFLVWRPQSLGFMQGSLPCQIAFLDESCGPPTRPGYLASFEGGALTGEGLGASCLFVKIAPPPKV